MTNYKIDDLDQKIIQLLSTDARLSNRKIATQLGFTEGTIRSRVKRLEDENLFVLRQSPTCPILIPHN